MPVLNAERFLEQSVRSILDQTFREFELIVVDDMSTDRTAEILHSFHDDRIIHVVSEVRLGLPESLNKGIHLARAEYIGRMDADDIADRQRLEIQYQFLVDHPDVGIVSTKILLINRKGHTTGKWGREYTPEEIYYLLHFSNILGHSTIMGKKSIFLEFGGYNSHFDRIEDFYLWQKISERYALFLIPRYLLRIRVHEESVSLKNFITQQTLLENLVRKRLESLLGEEIDPRMIFILRKDYSGFSRLKTPYPDHQQVLAILGLLLKVNTRIARYPPSYASQKRLEKVGDDYFTSIAAFSLVKSPLYDCVHVLRTIAKEREKSFFSPFSTLLLLKVYYRFRILIS